MNKRPSEWLRYVKMYVDDREAIHKWIKYYNEERIVVVLKNSPLKFKDKILRSDI